MKAYCEQKIRELANQKMQMCTRKNENEQLIEAKLAENDILQEQIVSIAGSIAAFVATIQEIENRELQEREKQSK